MPEIEHVVPSFDDVATLQMAFAAKCNFDPVDLYPRDGTEQLARIESRMAELARVGEDELLLCCSGMAAVTGVIDAFTAPERKIAFPQQSYSQKAVYLGKDLPGRGVRTVCYDSGSTPSVEAMLEKHQPNLVVAETVSNGPDAPVLDVQHLLDVCDGLDLDTTVLLDNTLPLSTAFPLDGLVDTQSRVVAVESATKSYLYNAELAGVVYSHNAEVMARMCKQRRMKGYGPNVAALDRIESLLPNGLSEFDQRNMRIFRNTARIALGAFAVTEGTELFVAHPLLPNHPNRQFADANLPHGATPVFFIQCGGSESQFAVAERLWAHPGIRSQAELGQSFGFDHTRILPDATFPMVRIAPGSETNPDQFVDSLSEALAA